MTSWSERLFGGLIPAVPVPCVDGSEVDFDALAAYGAWMAEQPVDGVAVWTETGRGRFLSRDQRRKLLELWREKLGPDLLIVADVGFDPETGAEDAVGLADLLLVDVPSPSSDASDGAAQCAAKVREAASFGMPLILNLGDSCKVNRESRLTLQAVLAEPEVAGVVVSTSGSVTAMQDLVTCILMGNPDKAILSGENRLLGYSLYRGCHGVLSGLPAMCTSLQRSLLDAWFMGEMVQFLELSRMVDHLAEAVFSEPVEGHVARLLTGLAHQGILPYSSANDPWGPDVPDVDLEIVRATIDALGPWARS